MCPLSPAPFQSIIPPVGLVVCGLAPSPNEVSLPHTSVWVLALMQRYSPRPLPHDRPHVSVSEALPSAFASGGILADTPYGWYLLTPMCERTCRITPFPVSMVASVGRCSPPGFVAVQTGQYRRLPAPYPVPFWLQRVSLLRWFAFTMALYTFAYAAHRCLLDGIPGVRLPGSAVYPRFRPLRTSRKSGG
jgi:hypothetical protein